MSTELATELADTLDYLLSPVYKFLGYGDSDRWFSPRPASPQISNETRIISALNDAMNGVRRFGFGVLYRMEGSSGIVVRLAGISGALAVGLGAYGAHAFRDRPDVSRDLKVEFDTANRYHLLHSVALLATPLCRFPKVTGSMFIAGMFLFCGSCYYHALTGENQVRRVTPFGGLMLIAAWLSMIL